MGRDYQANIEPEVLHTDVLVVGSGPIGATYARKLVDFGHEVLMVEVGSQDTKALGNHKKNETDQSMNEFIDTVQQDLTPLSPESSTLRAAAATRTVGGMSRHWTCATPAPHPTLEAPQFFSSEQWNEILNEARSLIGTKFSAFDESTRHELVKKLLNEAFQIEGRSFESIPLACSKEDGKTVWSSTATVLGDIIENSKFSLLSGHICKKIIKNGDTVVAAEIMDLDTRTTKIVVARQYAICAGAVLTPQILFNSGLNEELPALGKYLTERILTFCQVTMGKETLQGANILEKDEAPQVMAPVTEDKPWQIMVHRDAFQYGKIPEGVDEKSVVDIRAMGSMETNSENRVEFSMDAKDEYGMPKPTFMVTPSNDDLKRGAKMMLDMQNIATKLGSFVHGSEPTIMPPGTAMHISGTTRAGTSPADSVVDANSKVWGIENLYLGGCGVINTQMACNPTLTAMCFAIVGAESLNEALKA